MENINCIFGNIKYNILFIFCFRYEEENLFCLLVKKKKKVSLFVNIIILFIGFSMLLIN